MLRLTAQNTHDIKLCSSSIGRARLTMLRMFQLKRASSEMMQILGLFVNCLNTKKNTIIAICYWRDSFYDLFMRIMRLL